MMGFSLHVLASYWITNVIRMLIFVAFFWTLASPTAIPTIKSDDIPSLLHTCCVLTPSPAASTDTLAILSTAALAFRDEQRVCIGQQVDDAWWAKRDASADMTSEFLFYSRKVKDRTCLHALPQFQPKPSPIIGVHTGEHLVNFLNSRCGAFRTIDGKLNAAGLWREKILHSLYEIPQPRSECDEIDVPSQAEFFANYLSHSKPVIVKNALQNWTALRKWTNDFFYKRFGERTVHVKLSPDGEFEGCEKASNWEEFQSRQIPQHVKKQLEFPDLVVVRPAIADVPFKVFMDHITHQHAGSGVLSGQNVSAYLEYASIQQYMPELEEDIEPMSFVPAEMKRSQLNMWLSDGNTLGKLHFDPFDNILCQVSGMKEITLFSPNDSRALYEAHIPEAMLDFSATSGVFRRKRLLDSTSMVMSPVDIAKPDLKRFPQFASAHQLKCRLQPGDVLFMPAFWWHEVQSRPDKVDKRNLAVNFWYEPFLTKEFPCNDCKLDVNHRYHSLLEKPPVT